MYISVQPHWSLDISVVDNLSKLKQLEIVLIDHNNAELNVKITHFISNMSTKITKTETKWIKADEK